MKSMFNAKQRWSLRKLSIGVCSVLLGMTILGARQTASANTVTAAMAPTSAAIVPSASNQTAYATQQDVYVPSGYASALVNFRPDEPSTQAQTYDVSNEGKRQNVTDPSQPISTVGLGMDGSGIHINYNVKYNSNPADENEEVDPQNLTSEQESDLTNFAAATINQIRQKVQAQPNGKKVSAGYLRTSPYATEVGNKIVHEAYDNFTGNAHNPVGLSNAAQKSGIPAWVGENIGEVGGILAVQFKAEGMISRITMDILNFKNKLATGLK